MQGGVRRVGPADAEKMLYRLKKAGFSGFVVVGKK